MNDPRSRTLITVDELVGLLDARQPVVLLDVIDERGVAPEDRPKLPGALSVHLATDFSSEPRKLSHSSVIRRKSHRFYQLRAILACIVKRKS